MKLAIMQPYFFPYIGYFQLINEVEKSDRENIFPQRYFYISLNNLIIINVLFQKIFRSVFCGFLFMWNWKKVLWKNYLSHKKELWKY